MIHLPLSEFRSWLDQFNWVLMGSHPNRYPFYQLNGRNEALKDQLEKDGFFRFHTTNKGKQLVSLHQVIAFYYCGGIEALHYGFTCKWGETEIHHIDGNTFNAHPNNLVYIPTELHQILTNLQCQFIRNGRTSPVDCKLDREYKIWNRKGRRIQRVKEWLVNLISKTLSDTAWFTKAEISLKQLGKFIVKTAKSIRLNIDPTNLLEAWSDWLWTKPVEIDDENIWAKVNPAPTLST